jgi:fructokinase
MTDADVLVAGEALVDMLPDREGPLAAVESFTRRAGGAPANVAAALATLGRPPLFWTRVGDDPFGEFLLDTLAERGVPDDLVKRDLGASTPLAFVGHDADGDSSFTFYRDDTADTRLEPGGVSDATLAAVDWVHVGGVTLAGGPAREATYDLAARARAADCEVSFDPNARPELWTDRDFPASVDRLLDLATVVKTTPADAAAAGVEADDPTALAEAVLARGPHTALVTLGEAGAVGVADEDAPWGPASARVEGGDVDAVDATGAGDAFTAGAVAALSGGEPLREAVAFAAAVGAAATTARGAMAALPDRDAVRAVRGER